MTGLLKDVMHERADSLDAPQLDIDAIIRDGGQRRSRRFQTVAGGLVAATLVVAGGVALPGLLPGGERDSDAAAGVHSYDVAYAVGSTIHDGPRTVDAGVRISGLVQGVSGYVVADPQLRVHTVVDGETTQVGVLAEVDRPRILSDGDVVAWVDAADGGTLSVLDLATGERADTPLDTWPGEALIVRPGTAGEGQASIAAVDGRTVYVTDTRGVMAWDALDGDDPVLLPGAPGVEVRDVQDGQILHVVRTFESEERDGLTTMVEVTEQRVGPDLGGGRPVPGLGGALSPDGRSLAFVERILVGGMTMSSTSVGDVDGDTWTPVTTEYDGVGVYRWLDADTFAARAFTLAEGGSSAVLTCEASTATCAPVPEIDTRVVFVFANGEVSGANPVDDVGPPAS